MGFISNAINGSLRIICFLVAITFIPGIPPDMEFEAFSLNPPLPLEGGLALNNKLNNAVKLFVDQVKGPEHIEIYNNVLYTSLEGGYVAKVVDDKIVPIVKFGKKCDGIYEPEVCGRPLGLTFDSKGFLYAADAYYGVFKVNISTGEYNQLVSMDTEIDGIVPRLPNSLSVAKDGSVYWSDSSTSHSLHDGLYTLLGNGNGRLIKYDPNTKSNTVLIDKLHFANGVALSRDESFVVVSDLFRNRILNFHDKRPTVETVPKKRTVKISRYHLKGPSQGKTEVLLDRLPGYPDNIHSDGKGQFHVTLAVSVDTSNPGWVAMLGPYPLLRRLVARLLYLMELPVLKLNSYYPNYYSKVFTHWVGSFSMVPVFVRPLVTILFFNEDGKITSSLHATDGKISSITDIGLMNNYYYLGSFTNPYLARVEAS